MRQNSKLEILKRAWACSVPFEGLRCETELRVLECSKCRLEARAHFIIAGASSISSARRPPACRHYAAAARALPEGAKPAWPGTEDPGPSFVRRAHPNCYVCPWCARNPSTVDTINVFNGLSLVFRVSAWGLSGCVFSQRYRAINGHF
jgi:hypothetical protein